MEVECMTATLHDCELEQILQKIENDPCLGVKAVDFLKKMAYFDQSYGVDADLCYLVISKSTSNSIPNSTNEEDEAKKVLKILHDHKLIYEKNSNCFTSFQLLPSLQEKLLIQNRQNSTIIIELVTILQTNWISADYMQLSMSVPHVFHIHKRLKHFNWPNDTLKWSVYFGVQLLIDGYDMESGLEMVEDAAAFLKTVNFSKSVNEAHWIAIQMIRIHNETIMKSRKLLQPSDMICVKRIDGTTQDIRLDNYGSWILNQIRLCVDSKLDCDAIILVGVATLDRLQKHARFCNKPDELTLNWIISYNEKDWHSLNCFTALACFNSIDGWLEKMCHAYIRKLFEMQQCGSSDYSLNNVYLSWVCLRDLVKTSRIRDQMISALTDDEGLEFLFMNFKKCESSLESKEYFLKYQGQTVIEMLTPLLIHGKSEDIKKLLKSQKFWNFVILILIKHPFINERYDRTLENDLVCACEVYLDFLIATCNRNHDAMSEGFLKSFLSQDFLKTFTIVIKGASEFSEPRQRHTCEFYLFTILFTLFDNLNAVELADIYFSNEDIRKEIEELAQENFIFEVPEGCLREYRKHIKNFMDLYKIKTEATSSEMLTSIVNLVLCMTAVPEKYDWESDGDEKLQ